MRRGDFAFALQIRDGGSPDTTPTLPVGAKHDRPIYVLRDSALSTGPHHVSVMFARGDHATQAPLPFDAVLNFGAGFIELITIADGSPRLIIILHGNNQSLDADRPQFPRHQQAGSIVKCRGTNAP